MALKDFYRAEMAQKALERETAAAPYEAALAKLRQLYKSIIEDREFLDEIRAEVELFDDDLRIDPGKIMIVVTALPTGDFKMEYEVKRPDDYAAVAVPEVRTIEDAEKAIARLLAQYR